MIVANNRTHNMQQLMNTNVATEQTLVEDVDIKPELVTEQ